MTICALCGQQIPAGGGGGGGTVEWWKTDTIDDADVFAAYDIRWADDAASALLDVTGNAHHLTDDTTYPISGGWVSESGWEPIVSNVISGARVPIAVGPAAGADCTAAELSVFVAFTQAANAFNYPVFGGYEQGTSRRIYVTVRDVGGLLSYGTGSTTVVTGLAVPSVVCKTGLEAFFNNTSLGVRTDTTWVNNFAISIGSYINNVNTLTGARPSTIRGVAIYLRALTQTEREEITAAMHAQFHGDAPVSGGGIEITDPITYGLASAPTLPDQTGTTYEFYKGALYGSQDSDYGSHGLDLPWSYSKKPILDSDASLVVYFHGSGGGVASVNNAFAPGHGAQVEVRLYDMEAVNTAWREWWAYQPNTIAVQPYPSRRVTLALDYIASRYPEIDVDAYGLALFGQSMGGTGAVLSSMILEDADWRAKISWVGTKVGIIMPRRVCEALPSRFADYWPADDDSTTIWDDSDFVQKAVSDQVVRGIHYRGGFSTDDLFSEGPDGNTQVEFVNILETQKIGGAFFWVQNGHNWVETGYTNPALYDFETADQRVTLDRAHPAFTNSTGNYPTAQADRLDEVNYPRGHYNMGLLWDWANIVDTTNELTFPIKYSARPSLGAGIPDQPSSITVSVTPRRPKNFTIVDGATLNWSWDGGALSGTVVVSGDVATVDGIPLTSGAAYKTLSFTKP